ncbi:hypothetical protein BJ742DRAFT_794130, partial [Cladochytrium replicatum]
MCLVAAIPRSDFFSVIVSAKRTSVTVTVVIPMLVAVIVILGITLPIRRLAAEMSNVAAFDFSILECVCVCVCVCMCVCVCVCV